MMGAEEVAPPKALKKQDDSNTVGTVLEPHNKHLQPKNIKTLCLIYPASLLEPPPQ